VLNIYVWYFYPVLLSLSDALVEEAKVQVLRFNCFYSMTLINEQSYLTSIGPLYGFLVHKKEKRRSIPSRVTVGLQGCSLGVMSGVPRFGVPIMLVALSGFYSTGSVRHN
jgi:hypothetical protein